MPLDPVLESVLAALRTGYPDGIPTSDYAPLFAVLASRLTGGEVAQVAAELEAHSDPQSGMAIREAISDVTEHSPGDADAARVRERLAAGGWSA